MIFEAMLLALAGQADPDPLAMARAGKIQCYGPLVAEKTCTSTVRFVLVEGQWRSIVVMGLPDSGAFEIEMPATIEDGAVCTRPAREIFQNAKLTVAGAPMPAADAQEYRELLAEGYAPNFGKTLCARYRAEGDHFVAEWTSDGTLDPDMTQPFIWVGPAEGYHPFYRPVPIAALEPMVGKNACSIEMPDGDMLVSTVTLDGEPHPEMTQRMIWVNPEEGYTLGMP